MINKSIYFLHIPKTSGTSTIVLLDKLFDSNDIFTPQRWDIAFQSFSVETLKKVFKENHYRFYRGHFGYNKSLIRNKFTFTILRNPSNRSISQYKHMIRYPEEKGWFKGILKQKDESLLSILQDANRAHLLGNTQTKYLSSNYDPLNSGNFESFDDNPKFYLFNSKHPYISCLIALTRLLSLNFFGLQEYHEESMIMLAKKIGVKVDLLNDRKQYFNNESFSQQYNLETNNLLHQINNIDDILYNLARKFFERDMIKFVNRSLNCNINLYQYLSQRNLYLNELKKRI